MLKADIVGKDGFTMIETFTVMAVFGEDVKGSGANATVDPAAYPTVA